MHALTDLGVDITGETCPHYLMLSSDDYERLGGIIRVNPPVREAVNQDKLWDALADGTIDIIATDHAPHATGEKIRPDIWTVDCGFSGVETQMPLMLTAMSGRQGSIRDYVKWSAEKPAKSWGLCPRKGALEVGSDADIAIVDMKRPWTIDDALTQSRAKVSPFHGMKASALPIHTLVRGRFVMKDRTLQEDSRGWGGSVHSIQEMSPADVRNAATIMLAVTTRDASAKTETMS